MTKGFHPTFTIGNRITSGLTIIEAWIREMGRRALILEAHYTTHIEGTRLAIEWSAF